MPWEKVPQPHVLLFNAAMPSGPGIERRQMFGCPAGFVNGHMFCGAHERNFLVKLAPDDLTEAIASEGFTAFAPMGRPMSGYACLPRGRVKETAFVAATFARALDYVRTLPPKSGKASAKTRVADAKVKKATTGARTTAKKRARTR
ncbi:MAG: TfoX/Sxy family protein [Vicinamibacterales bacterium]